jgi:hypothetical protein
MVKLYAIIAAVFILAGTAFFTVHNTVNLSAVAPTASTTAKDIVKEIKVIHIPTPTVVKALYVTFYSFESPKKLRDVTLSLEKNNFNALVIDVRSDGTGLFDINTDKVKGILSGLHDKNIYLIGRIVAFKNGENAWYDPASRVRWEQIAQTSKLAHDLGFDEINYDYVRYGGPNEAQSQTPIEQRRPTIQAFFEFLNKEVRQKYGFPISADIFGTTFINPEAGIGQNLEDAALNFDYIMPMPYPSHWALGTFGIKHPGTEPYQTVFQALTTGWAKVKDNPKRIASLRSWIQAFNIESISPWKLIDYTPQEINAQIKACTDAGCVGWVLWNGFSTYRSDYSTSSQTISQ